MTSEKFSPTMVTRVPPYLDPYVGEKLVMVECTSSVNNSDYNLPCAVDETASAYEPLTAPGNFTSSERASWSTLIT